MRGPRCTSIDDRIKSWAFNRAQYRELTLQEIYDHFKKSLPLLTMDDVVRAVCREWKYEDARKRMRVEQGAVRLCARDKK